MGTIMAERLNGKKMIWVPCCNFSFDGGPTPTILAHHWFVLQGLHRLFFVSYVNTSRWSNVGSMLGHRLRRWSNINPTMGQRLVGTYEIQKNTNDQAVFPCPCLPRLPLMDVLVNKACFHCQDHWHFCDVTADKINGIILFIGDKSTTRGRCLPNQIRRYCLLIYWA